MPQSGSNPSQPASVTYRDANRYCMIVHHGSQYYLSVKLAWQIPLWPRYKLRIIYVKNSILWYSNEQNVYLLSFIFLDQHFLYLFSVPNSFWTQTFLDQKFFELKSFVEPTFFGLRICWTQNLFSPKIFFYPTFFDLNFFGLNKQQNSINFIKPGSICFCSLTVSAWTEPQLSSACLSFIA